MSRVRLLWLVAALAMFAVACSVDVSAITMEETASADVVAAIPDFEAQAPAPAALAEPAAVAEPTPANPTATPVPAADDEPAASVAETGTIDSGLNDGAAWDQHLLDLYEDAGGFGRPVGEFAVAAGGFCLGFVTDEQTQAMFPTNAALGEAVRNLSGADCELLALDFGGSGPTGISTWEDMLVFRFSRAVSFRTFDDFVDLATYMCSNNLIPSSASPEFTGLSTSIDFELQGLYFSDECDLLTAEPEPTSAGDRIFVMTGVNGTDISVFDLTTGNTTLLAQDTGSATVSPDGQTVAYVKDGGIRTVESDSGEDRRVSLWDTNAFDPIWSPDGELFFVEEQIGAKPVLTAQDIFEGAGCDWPGYRLGSADDEITEFQAYTGFGEWSRLGERVVWRTDGSLTYFERIQCETEATIKAVDTTTGETTDILQVPTDLSIYPNFSVSPVDDRLAISSIQAIAPDEENSTDLINHDSQLFIEQPDGELLAVDGVTGTMANLAWSPDGQWVAFEHRVRTDGGSQFERTLYVVSADGQDLRKLSDGNAPSRGLHFRWSPDSLELAYSQRVQGERHAVLNVVDLAGSIREIGKGAPIAWR